MGRQYGAGSRVHVALNTAHFEQAVEFYTALLGIQPSKLKDGYAKFEPEQPMLNLTLNQAEHVEGSQINHLGIEVRTTGNVEMQRRRLQSLGLLTEVEQNTTCCYAKQDKVWVHDPDGNAIEVFVVLEHSESRDGTGRASDHPICCKPLPILATTYSCV